jgi:hypothetical protein
MTEYGRIHTDGSRSGGQPVIKTQHCPNCEAQAAEIERLRIEAQAQYDRGYYEGCTHPLQAENERLRAAMAEMFPLTDNRESYGEKYYRAIRIAREALGEQQ